MSIKYFTYLHKNYTLYVYLVHTPEDWEHVIDMLRLCMYIGFIFWFVSIYENLLELFLKKTTFWSLSRFLLRYLSSGR